MSKFYLTTAIPYVNADPHIGFAMELIQADVLARYYKLKGDKVRLCAGADENSLKNVQAAEKEGLPVKEFIDQKTQRFIDLIEALKYSKDDFVRTTEERHRIASQKLWLACDKAGDVYKKKYKGLYCVGCEEFKSPKDLIDGLCSEHKVAPDEVEEENYFFRLSKYQDQLLNLIQNKNIKIIPESRANETIEFIKQGLEDFSISRSVARAKGWGIEVPGDSTQIMYVWFDALTNYITSLGYGGDEELFKEFWTNNENRCHLIGKGITRFHAIYWPAMLLSAGLNTPSRIYVHGYLTVNGEKISKSSGNTVDPFSIISKYGSEVVRYYLMREVPTGGDGDFSEKRITERYNGELANGLGNLISRVSTLAEGEFTLGDLSLSIDRKSYDEAMEDFELNKALDYIWKIVGDANGYITDRKPWAEKKNSIESFNQTITTLIQYIHSISKFLHPFMPGTVDSILDTFSLDINKTVEKGLVLNIRKSQPLFPRLN